MSRLWKVVTWSFRVLYSGDWPTRDCDNQPIDDERGGTKLAGGYYAALWIVRGDLDYYRKSMNLEGVGERSRCIKCKTNTSSTPWASDNQGRRSGSAIGGCQATNG